MWRNALVSLALTIGMVSCAYEFRDDFSKYPQDSDPEPGWKTTGFAWLARGGSLVAEDPSKTFALVADAPHGRFVTAEAAVTISGTTSKDWKTAGVVVFRDKENYWHLALAQTPDAQPEIKRHIELIECLGGKWLANTGGATQLPPGDEAIDGTWEMGKTYRLRIELDPTRICGAVSDAAGKIVWRRIFRFSEKIPAVTTGRPGLDSAGFTATFDDFAATVKETAAPPASERPPVYPAYSLAPMTRIKTRATGFFRVDEVDGVWWLIDPKGYAFYGIGTDHVRYRGHWCQKLGYAPYGRFVEKKYKNEEEWASAQADRLKSWGFNLVAAGHSESLRGRGLVHTEFVSFGSRFSAFSDIAPKTTWTGFPNVFHPRWPAYCMKYARQYCGPERDDPCLVGYFLDNELEWFGKDHTEYGLVHEAFKKPADHSAKQALMAFLKGRYARIEDLNKSWGTKYTGFEQLANATDPPSAQGEAVEKDQCDFLELIAENYFRYTTEAIRKCDPNHLVIGCRFAGRAPKVLWKVAGKYLDVVSCNYYGSVDLKKGTATPTRDKLVEYFGMCGKPMMLTEWSHPALDSGLPCEHGAGQRFDTQKERTEAFEIYQKMLATLPFMVSSHFFMYLDEPALGISDTFPEDTNYGLINEKDEPYPELTSAAARLNPRLADYHAGLTTEAKVEISSDGRTALVTNSGKLAGKCLARVWEDGAPRTVLLAVGTMGSASIPLLSQAKAGAHFVAVEIDAERALAEADRSDNFACRQVYLPGESRPARGVTLALANPTAAAIRNVPVSVLLKEAWPQDTPGGARAMAPNGAPIDQQLEDGPDGKTLVVLIAELKPYGQASATIVPDDKVAAVKAETLPGTFTITNGPLTLRKSEKNGDLVDEVSLEGVALGKVQAMIQEDVGQNLWLAATDIESLRRVHGPVRDLLEYTVALKPEGAQATTEVDKNGKPATQDRQPGAYRAVYRLNIVKGQPFFTLLCNSVTNVGAKPWRLVSYFHYLLPRIGGDMKDDDLPVPRVPDYHGARTVWFDEKVGAGYGAVVPEGLQGHFWLDKGGRPHPDIRRSIDQTLAPGAGWTSAEPEVYVFGVRGAKASKPWNALAEDLTARATVTCEIFR